MESDLGLDKAMFSSLSLLSHQGFLAIFSGIVGLTGIFMMRETFAPVLLRRRARRMTKATGHFYLSITDQGKDISIKAQFKHAVSRPWLLLFKEPIVLILSFYLAVMYGTLYSLFAAVPIVVSTMLDSLLMSVDLD